MTTATLRPNGTDSNSGTVTGAGSAHAALSDDSDSSYITFDPDGEQATLNLGTFTIPAGGITKSVRPRWRARRADAEKGTISVRTSAGATVASYTVALPASFAEATGAYAAVNLSQSEVNGLTVKMLAAGGATTDLVVAEAYVDVKYVTKPSTSVTAVSPDPYTASTTVPIEWSNTLDSDGGGQKRYEVKVFTDAQFGAGGFDPDTSTPYFTSGEIVSSNTTADVGPLENGDTYRAYVRVAQTVNGASHWSDWAYDEFTMSVTTSEVDTVSAVATDASGLITVTVAWDNTSTGWEFIEVQRSIDGGITWVDVRGATYVATADSGATDFEVVDHEVPNGTSAIYRARPTWLSTGPVTGSWVESSAESWSSTDTWLKVPGDPSLNTTVKLRDLPRLDRPRRVGVFRVLGRTSPVVVSDVRGAAEGSLRFWFRTDAESAAIQAALDAPVVMLVGPTDWHRWGLRYLAVGAGADDWENDQIVGVRSLRGVIAVDVVEVDAPADPDAGR